MKVLIDIDSTDDRPISHDEINALILEINGYGDESPRPKPGKDKATRPLHSIRMKYPDPLPPTNCLCARNCGDGRDTFDPRDLENIISAGRQWMAVVRNGRPSLVWQRVGTGCYRLRRGRHNCSAPQADSGRAFVERRRVPPRPPTPASWRAPLPDLYDERQLVYYLKELYLRTRSSLDHARFGLRELINRNPHYPWTHCLLICTQQQQMDYGYVRPTDLRAEIDRAREVVLRADGPCYSFHIAQGTYFFHRHQVNKAIREFEQAAQMSSYFAAWRWLAECYATLGETQKALDAIRRAGVNCDYAEPSLDGIEMLIQVFGEKPQNALQLSHRSDFGQTHPKNAVFRARAHLALAFKAIMKHDKDRAAILLLEAEKLLDAAKAAGENESPWLLTEYLSVYGAGLEIGRCNEEGAFEMKYNHICKRCQELPRERAAIRAFQHVACGHYDQALMNLDRAVEERDSMVLDLQWDPRFIKLRDKQGFRRLCTEMRNRFTKDLE